MDNLLAYIALYLKELSITKIDFFSHLFEPTIPFYIKIECFKPVLKIGFRDQIVLALVEIQSSTV